MTEAAPSPSFYEVPNEDVSCHILERHARTGRRQVPLPLAWRG